MPCHHGRGRRGAQSGEQRHFGEQHRIAGRDLGKQAERRHGLQTFARVLGMAVHIFEAIDLAVRCRHQLDDAVARMARHARCLIEQLPAAEIRLDIVGKLLQDRLDPDLMHKAHHVVDTHKRHEGLRGRFKHVFQPLKSRITKPRLIRFRLKRLKLVNFARILIDLLSQIEQIYSAEERSCQIRL